MEAEKLNELVEEFIEDLAAGRHPRVYTLFEQEPDLKEEIEPELELVLALSKEPMPIPAFREARILSRIFEDVSVNGPATESLTMANLLSSDNSLVQQAKAKGLTDGEIEALRRDQTTLRVEDAERNVVVSDMARRLNIQFWKLKDFVNGILNNLTQPRPRQSLQASFARKDKDNQSEPEDRR